MTTDKEGLAVSPVGEAYLELLKGCLTRSLFGEPYAPINPRRGTWKAGLLAPVQQILRRMDAEIVRRAPFDAETRAQGLDSPAFAETMIGLRRLDNIQSCVTDVIGRGVPGDLIETGVWRGGATIFMRALLKVHDEGERTVWVADSFDGLPKPDTGRWPADVGDEHHLRDHLRVTQDEVRANFARYGLLDEQVRFLAGFFEETLPTAPIDTLAVLRLDGDMYGSTMEALQALYPKLSPGGYVIVDDYLLPGCQKAVTDFRERHEIRDPIHEVDVYGVWWQRGEA